MNREQYKLALQDDRWKALRLKVLARDGYKCTACGIGAHSSSLHVCHTKWPSYGKMPWEVTTDCLTTLCADCHALKYASRLSREAKHLRNKKRTVFITIDKTNKVAEGMYDPDGRAFS